ncbi:maltose ABC transporter permease [Boudabousia tangfeifanii]|uniref:Maltose/maltodextrin transport system permease protein n=1 Tax=Boudabousia tangfeifanii TaxID=1912795 RepID=A0A1D9MMM5_9ACTO|nr:ABC transporter permease subunit [Boudabousia tangfeifanii]AOZ73498.1 maltose ABC transporter permease [Boudabousia tangfeifanii]
MDQSTVKTKRFDRFDLSWGFWVKVALMALINALGVYGLLAAWAAESYLTLAVVLVTLIIADVIYFSRRFIPAKYLFPGLAFLLVYQVFVMGYTGFVSFTNYGTGHNSTKADAITQILAQHQKRVPGSPTINTTVVEKNDKLSLAIWDAEKKAVLVGNMQHPLTLVEGAKANDKAITEVPGYQVLKFADLVKRQQEVAGLKAPLTDDPNDGFYVTTDGTKGFLAKSDFRYDEEKDELLDTTNNVVYQPNGEGAFADPEGNTIMPGWRVPVGFANYTNMAHGSDLAWPFFNALVWSFIFAIFSVVSTFAFGLLLALVFHDKRIRGRKIYQSLFILPYAFPAFLSTLVWKGMLNTKFGFINEVLLGGAEIPWLTNGTLAKVSILGVNLWLGFPYMFLICLGALQALPEDIMEAAKIDGAGPIRTLFSVKLPLILVSTMPLLIASFAFNFNNFSLIYMLTGGGPNYPGASLPVGETDILISMVYKIAFEGGSQNYGLASALSILIFLVVGVISYFGLKRSNAMGED